MSKVKIDLPKYFYRVVTKEFLNNDTIADRIEYGDIKYGIPTSDLIKNEVKDYDELISLVKRAKIEHKEDYLDLYIEKHFGKEYLYSHSKAWVEEGMFHAGRINRNEFKYYLKKQEIEKVEPSLRMLIDCVPFEQVVEYLKELNSEQITKAWKTFMSEH